MVSRHNSDVLAIGTGGTGLRALFEAHERGAVVLVVCKSPVGYNNTTVVVGGGFRTAMGGLTPEEHMERARPIASVKSSRKETRA